MGQLIRIILISCVTLVSLHSVAKVKSCILFYEVQSHPFYDELQKLMKSATEQTVMYETATPANFLDCIKEHQAEEITIVAHAFVSEDERYRIGFFFPNDNHVELYERSKEVYRQKMRDANEAFDRAGCGERGAASNCFKLGKEKEDADQVWYAVAGADPGEYFYDKFFGHTKHVFLRGNLSVFKKAQNLLQAEVDGGSAPSLKRIRLMACEMEKLKAAYPEFRNLMTNFNISIDEAPPNKFLSWVYGAKVTSPDVDWMKGSIY